MRKPKLWEWITCIVVVLIAAMVLWPVTACACSSSGSAQRAACLSNLKQQGTAVALYMADWHDRLPNRDHWNDQLRGYIKYSKRPFDDWVDKKLAKGGYAYNAALSNRSYNDFAKPAETPLTYDSDNFGSNASDMVASLPQPARHKGRNNMSYLDSHARSLPPPKP